MRISPFLLSLLCLLSISSSGNATEGQAPAKALIWDLNRIVELEQQSGWEIDHYEFESMLSSALYSMCRSPEKIRAEALALLDQEVEALGGDPQGRLTNLKGDPAQLSNLMTRWRIRELLRLALQNQAKCPFWIAENENYRGLHSERNRVSYHLEGGGSLVTRIQGENVQAGGGGGGRASIGYGFSSGWDLRTGVDLGGSAMTAVESDVDSLSIDGYLALPITLRHIGALYRQEVEIAPMLVGLPGDDTLRYGVRVGGLFGISSLRVREVLPWVGLGIYGEYAFAKDNLPAIWTVRAGARVGFSWSSGKE